MPTTISAWNTTLTISQARAKLAQLRDENAKWGESDDRVTFANAIKAALAQLPTVKPKAVHFNNFTGPEIKTLRGRTHHYDRQPEKYTHFATSAPELVTCQRCFGHMQLSLNHHRKVTRKIT